MITRKKFFSPVYDTDNTPIATGDTVTLILKDGGPVDVVLTNVLDGGRTIEWDTAVDVALDTAGPHADEVQAVDGNHIAAACAAQTGVPNVGDDDDPLDQIDPRNA